jgi:hypothetical protein
MRTPRSRHESISSTTSAAFSGQARVRLPGGVCTDWEATVRMNAIGAPVDRPRRCERAMGPTTGVSGSILSCRGCTDTARRILGTGRRG